MLPRLILDHFFSAITKILSQMVFDIRILHLHHLLRGRSRTAATSNMDPFVIIVNGCRPLTIITKNSILDVAAVLDPPLLLFSKFLSSFKIRWKKVFELYLNSIHKVHFNQEKLKICIFSGINT